jgi:hypothetical protein
LAAGSAIGTYAYVSDAAGSRTVNMAFQFQISSPPAGPNPSPPGGTTAEMILRGSNSSATVMGQYEIYDLGNNAILAGYSLGRAGTGWQFAGLGQFNGSDTTDMLLRNANTGGFEVYDVSNNIVSGTKGLLRAAIRTLDVSLDHRPSMSHSWRVVRFRWLHSPRAGGGSDLSGHAGVRHRPSPGGRNRQGQG